MGLRLRCLLALLALAILASGCVLPKGNPVLLDNRTGDHWSGEAVLLEVSPDRQRCYVAVRSRALFVEKKWVPCRYVHDSTG